MKKMITKINLLFVGCLLMVLSVQKVNAQIQIVLGQTVTENFDAIGTNAITVLPTGWLVDKITNDVRTVGTYATALTMTERRAGDNMSTTAANGIYNYGAGDPAVATDRAVGFISSSSATKSGNLYLQLQNNGLTEIPYFTISYDVEKYRKGNNPEGFSIQMYYSTDGTTWTNAGADFLTSFPGADGSNEGYTPAPGDTEYVSNKNLNVSLASGNSLYLAWNYSVTATTTTSNAQALAIDNFSIQAKSYSGIFESYVTTNQGSNYYDLSTLFDGKDFGDIESDQVFLLKGGQVKTWKTDPPDDITGALMMYRIYEQGLTPLPDFDTIVLPWRNNLPNPGDQLWENDTMSIDILNLLPNGDYNIEVYYAASYTSNGNPFYHIDNNNGDNYIAEFTVISPTPKSGIFERYIVTNTGSDIYTEGANFDNSDLGIFLNTDVLTLKGGQVKTWKIDPPDDITAARMFYRTYIQGTTPPTFTSVNLPWAADLPNNNDQLWENIAHNFNILNGLPAGYYFLEVYFEADYTKNGTPDIHVDNNNGDNYKAEFTVVAQGCSAYTLPFSEGFNAVTIPTCWTEVQEVGATVNWTFVTTSTNPSTPYEGTHFARLYNPSFTAQRVKLITPPIDLTGATLPFVRFRHFMKAWTTDQDELRVYYRTNLTSPWVLLAEYTSDVSVWTERKIFLPNATATYQIAFEGNVQYGYGVAIDNVVVTIPPPKDYAVVEWVSPKSNCNLSATEHIVVKVANLGSQIQTDVPIVASIDGGTTIIGPEILPGNIQPGDTLTYVFNNTANFSTLSVFYSGALVMLQNDSDHSNDTILETVYSKPVINTYPHLQNFDFYSGWSPEIINGEQQWELGLPSQTQLNTDYSGMNSNAWMTKLSVNYANDANVFLLSPCLNFTNLTLPMLSLYLNIKTEANYDAMVLESSVDGGATWTKVIGDAGFYNNNSALGDVAPPKWSGTNGGWTKYETSLPDLANEPNVKLRFRFQSDDSGVNEGVAIDEIRIYEPISNDVGVASVIAPINSPCGYINDTIKIVVQNYGFANQDTIPVKINVVKPDASVLNFTDTLFTNINFNEKDTLISFVLNTTQSGIYNITAFTALTSDLDNTNDTMHYTFTVTLPDGIPYVQDFNGTVVGWMHDMSINTGHGNTTKVIYENLWSNNKTAYAQSPKIGTVTNGDFLLFDYRIVDYDSPWPGTTIGAGDTIKIFVSTDCGATFEILDTIYDNNHVTSDVMLTKQYPLDDYIGSDVIVRFELQRQLTGDYFVDIDNFIISSVPVVDLGNDTLICSDASIILDAGNFSPFTIYDWKTLNNPNTIATTQTITVDSAATYIVVVDNGFGMFDSDTIVLDIKQTPVINLGADILICNNDTVVLDAGLETTTIYSEGLRGVLPNDWTMHNEAGLVIEQTGSGGYMLLDDAGDWVVTEAYDLTGIPNVKLYVDIASYGGTGAHNLMLIDVSNNNGATWSAQFPFATDTTTGTTYVTQGPFTVTATGTQVKFRFRRPNTTGRGVRFRDFKITSSAPYASYDWSTGETTKTINVTTADTYICEVQSANGCSASDTIEVDFFTVTPIDFGLDTAICVGDILVLDAGPSFVSYEWNDNSTQQTLNVTNAGTFWVVAEDNNGCTSTDTISVIISPLPVAALGPDTSYCANSNITLDAGPGINYSYTWKKLGSPATIGTLQTLVVNSIGTYYVIVDNGCTATATDTIEITERTLPVVNLGQDMNICPQTPSILDAGNHKYYLWSTGDTTAQIAIILPDVYMVTVTGFNNCTNSDTIIVGLFAAPTPPSLGNDTIICIYNQITLDAGTNYASYQWFDSSGNQTLTIDGSVYGLGVVEAYVVVTDVNACTATDTINITVDPCTGFDESALDMLHIYPNPSNGRIYIELGNVFENTCDITVYNMQGQVVLSEKILNINHNSTLELNLSKQARGVYYIKLVSGNHVNYSKIILN